MEANVPLQFGLSHQVEHGFKKFDHGATDVVLAVAYNSSGSRIALGSADHRIRVYDVQRDGAATLIDQWRGHDAEVLDASLPDLPCLAVLRLGISRSNGLDQHWGSCLARLEVIINLSCGAKIPLKHPEEAAVSGAYSLNRQVITLPTFLLISRLSKMRSGLC